MEGPIRGIRFIHAAMQREAAAIEDQLRGNGDVGELAVRVKFFTRVARLHHLGEEVGFFPDLEARRPGIVAPYQLDHEVDVAMLAEIDDLSERAANAGGGERADLMKRLRGRFALFRELVRVHIRKEEELLVPLVEELFSPAEQAAQIGRMMGQFPPAELGVVIPWLVENLSGDDRVAYVALLQRNLPPERFDALAGAIQGRMGEAAWAAVTGALPEQSAGT